MPNDLTSKAAAPRRAGKRPKTQAPGRINELPLFDSLGFLTSIGAGRATRKYARKSTVFQQGDPCGGIYFIKKGKVRLTIVSAQGKEGVIAILGPDEFFGEGCLAGQPMHLSTASAIEESEIVKVEMETMVRTLAEQPNLAQFFISHLLLRNIQIEADLVDQLFNSSEKRLARVLLLLANLGKEGKMEIVMPKINQDVLAARVGTTRSRINFFMNKFRKLGFIEYNGGGLQGGLKVHSALLNVIVHD